MLDINKSRYIEVIGKVTRLDRLFVSRLISRRFNPGADRWSWAAHPRSLDIILRSEAMEITQPGDRWEEFVFFLHHTENIDISPQEW